MAEALPIAYLNGSFLPVAEARISPLDRGFLFADAVYEVIAVYGGRALLIAEHLQRLERSLGELRIDNPHDRPGWCAIVDEIVTRNGGGDMGVYLQVSRGAGRARDHAIPAGIAPTVFVMASPLAGFDPDAAGISAITAEDNRWGRCDIKSTALLANVLLRERAQAAGAAECILLREGCVTEGASSSVLIVEERTVITRPNDPRILPGTTIRLVRDIVTGAGFAFREEPISEKRLRGAAEIWITSALRGVLPVTRLDGQPVGTGLPGPAWRMVAQGYARHTRQ